MRQLHLLSETKIPTLLSEVTATHCRLIRSSLITNTFTCNKLINSYIKCNELNHAWQLFDEMPHKDTGSWNTILSGYKNSGNFIDSWGVIKSMKKFGFWFDGYTFVSILKCVTVFGDALCGRQVHSDVVKMGFDGNAYAASALLSMYAKFSGVVDAEKVFEDMPLENRDTSCWNTIITGYVNSGNFFGAWVLLQSMKRVGFLFDCYTFGSILKGIAIGGSVVYGEQIHVDVVKMGFHDNVYAASALLDMYAKLGFVEDAYKVFKYMPERNSVSWNALIAGYAENGDFSYCVELFMYMEKEGVRVDDGTLAPIIALIDDVKFYATLQQLHGKVTKSGLEYENTVVNAMITAYSECGCVEDSKRVFLGAEGYQDLVTWNAMLAAYLGHGIVQCGFNLFLDMVSQKLELDAYSYSIIISACYGDAQQAQGKSLHCLVIKKGFEHLTLVSNALISMYLKSDSSKMGDAFKVFNQVPVKDRISWNTILTGFSQKGMSETALTLFRQMHHEYMVIDQYAFAAVLKSCSDLATLRLGQQIHSQVLKSGLHHNEYVASALIFMYSKCGIIVDSWKSFDASRKESSVTWNSILFAYAQHGQGKIALDLFYLMTERKVKMDHITFVATLTACSHVGLVDEGINLLKSMELKYGIQPQMENYACAIDLLGRARRLSEAKELIKEMPFEPDGMVWKTLLGACRACGDIDLATKVAGHLLELEPGEHCTYVLLSDMYGHLKRWDEKASLKRLMRENGVKKIPGWSWIELQNDVHAFNAEDYSHPNCHEIYQTLNELMGDVKLTENPLVSDIIIDDVSVYSVLEY